MSNHSPPKTIPDAVPNPDLSEMTGLEMIQGIANGTLPQAPIAVLLNFKLIKATKGSATFHGTPQMEATNPMGGVHGGWYGSILDSALACAIHTTLDAGIAYTTLEYKVNITRAIKPGATVECVGTVDHIGRTTGVATAKIMGIEDGRVYATGSTTCIVLS